MVSCVRNFTYSSILKSCDLIFAFSNWKNTQNIFVSYLCVHVHANVAKSNGIVDMISYYHVFMQIRPFVTIWFYTFFVGIMPMEPLIICHYPVLMHGISSLVYVFFSQEVTLSLHRLLRPKSYGAYRKLADGQIQIITRGNNHLAKYVHLAPNGRPTGWWQVRLSNGHMSRARVSV